MGEAIFSLIISGKQDAILQLVRQNKMVINSTDRMGRTPLMEAVIQRKFEICEFLIQAGADVNLREARKWTALHFAAQEYDYKIVELLLNSGADIDAEDHDGNTPLYRSLFGSKGQGEVIKLLLQRGADKDHKNQKGSSPWDLAQKVTNFDLKKYFS